MKLDDAKNITIHAGLIQNKYWLQQIYLDFYRQILKFAKSGKTVELGSGGGFIKQLSPKIITTDVVKGPGIDLVVDATALPFPNHSINQFVMLDVLHHIKEPDKALQEMNRCLKSGGKIIMIEPYITFFSYFVYRYIHPEPYLPKSAWKINGRGRLSAANTALPWIIFSRDKKTFTNLYPKLKIKSVEPHTPWRYLISGGLTHSPFLPNFCYPIICKIENLVSPWNKYFGMFATIVIEKKP